MTGRWADLELFRFAETAGRDHRDLACGPPCDTITIDGVASKGLAKVSAGKHVVVGSKKGYESQGKALVAKGGTTEKIFFPLAKTGGKKDCGKFLKRCD